MITAGDADPRHGSINGYSNLKCRCQECRVAWRAYCAGRRQDRFATLTPDDPRHGLRDTYQNFGCRCPDCTAAVVAYNKTLSSRNA